jgi:hypothetical protein
LCACQRKKYRRKNNAYLLGVIAIFSIALELATAIPAAKAPTIGDNPKTAANAEAPKHDAVAAASTTPSFPLEVKLIIFGRTIAAKIVRVSHSANPNIS